MEKNIGDVASTSFVTLYCHAIETQSEHPVLKDPKSVEITTELNKTLAQSDDLLDRMLVSGTIDRNLVVHIALRAKRYDEYARDFMNRNPRGVIVNIGCGLDSRFLRIDDGTMIFYDLDLPEVIEVRKRFFRKRQTGTISSPLQFSSSTGWTRSLRKEGRSCSWRKECSCT